VQFIALWQYGTFAEALGRARLASEISNGLTVVDEDRTGLTIFQVDVNLGRHLVVE